LLVVDDDWRELGLGSKLRRQGVSGGGFQKGDVEDWMDPHRSGEIQLISMGRDFLEDSKSSQSLVIQLRRWPSRLDVSTIQPYMVANAENRRRGSVFVGMF
jgi:hypothetical protein